MSRFGHVMRPHLSVDYLTLSSKICYERISAGESTLSCLPIVHDDAEEVTINDQQIQYLQLLQDGYYRNAKVVFGWSCPMPQCTIHGLYQCRNQIWLGQYRHQYIMHGQPLGLLVDTGGCPGSSLIPGNHPHSARAGRCHSITIYSYLHNKITYLFHHLFPSPIQQVAIQVQNIHYDTLQSNKSKANKELKMRGKNIKKCEKKCQKMLKKCYKHPSLVKIESK